MSVGRGADPIDGPWLSDNPPSPSWQVRLRAFPWVISHSAPTTRACLQSCSAPLGAPSLLPRGPVPR
eukprot:4231855-Alexandrium_andersonii.AAC.1